LLISYRELKHDPETGIRRVAETLSVNLTEEELAKVVEKSSFQYMQGINHKFSLMPDENLPWGSDFKMMRAGETGNSSELISREQQIKIDKYFIQELKEIGSDFPYEEFFILTE